VSRPPRPDIDHACARLPQKYLPVNNFLAPRFLHIWTWLGVPGGPQGHPRTQPKNSGNFNLVSYISSLVAQYTALSQAMYFMTQLSYTNNATWRKPSRTEFTPWLSLLRLKVQTNGQDGSRGLIKSVLLLITLVL
jgi:hypothetical protein